jgi:hypothetical protein
LDTGEECERLLLLVYDDAAKEAEARSRARNSGLSLDPLGCVGIGQQAVRRARSACGYHSQILAPLLRAGGDVLAAALEAKDSLNRTALLLAAEVGAADAVQALLDAGATVSPAVS